MKYLNLERHRAMFALAADRYRQGEYQEALTLLDELYVAFPEDREVLFARGCSLLRLGNGGEAARSGEALLRLGDPRGSELVARGRRLIQEESQANLVQSRGVWLPVLGALLVILLVVNISTPELFRDRSFRFDAEKSIGTLLYRDVPFDHDMEWQPLGSAQGEWTIDRGRETGLVLAAEASLAEVPEELRRWARRLELRVTDDAQVAELISWSNLRELKVWGSSEVGDEFLSGLDMLPRLKKITLLGGSFSDEGMNYLKDLPKLESVDVQNLSELTEAGLARLFEIKNLRELRLALPHLDDGALDKLTDARRLRSLGLERMSITAAGLLRIAKLPYIERLSLKESAHLSDEMLEALKKLGNLEYLALDGGAFTDLGLSHLGELPKLKKLRLENNSHITDAGVAQIQERLNLNEIVVVNCAQVLEWTSANHSNTLRPLSLSRGTNTLKEACHEYAA